MFSIVTPFLKGLIMKKTLVFLSVLGVLSGSAWAADVTVYGRIDTGLQLRSWEHNRIWNETNASELLTRSKETSWSMESGSLTPSRIGIKGSEQISDNLTVGFVLEKGFESDTGVDDDGFDRESVIYVKSNLGTFYAGRINSIWSDAGSTSFWAGNYVALGTGNGVGLGTGLMVEHDRTDNRITYVSPDIAGFKFYAEYGFGENDYENTSQTDRPAALGVNYSNGALSVGMVVTYMNEITSVGDFSWESEDEYTVSIGTSYDFGVAKVKLGGQYYWGANKVGAFTDLELSYFDECEGYAVTIGTDIPVFGGMLTIGGGYADGEDKADYFSNYIVEYKGYDVATYYQYPLSKQTKVYAGIGYEKLEAEYAVTGQWSDNVEHKAIKAMMGMAHYF